MPGEERKISSFESILWGPVRAEDVATVSTETVSDLNLDQIFLLAGGAKHDAVHRRPLNDIEVVRYRQDVFRDLGNDRVREGFEAFVDGMSSVYKHLEQGRKLHHPQQQDRWQLDAEAVYCRTVQGLNDALREQPLRGVGLQNFRTSLAAYVEHTGFQVLADGAAEVRRGVDSVRYTVHVKGRRLVVDRYAGQPDYGATIGKVFDRLVEDRPDFSQGADRWPDMNEVEEQVIAVVAEQHPEVFQRLAEHTGKYREFVSAAIAQFNDDIAFYLDYLRIFRQFRERGIPFCIPEVTEEFDGVSAEDAYDMALASKLIHQNSTPVGNDFRLRGAERVLVVTGPNQGGKSTFARTVGQLTYLASLGCPVAADRARVLLPDSIFTHFVREDDVGDLDGGLDGGLARELTRMHEILGNATQRSLLVMNESLSTTAVSDGIRLGREVLRMLIEGGTTTVFVTFLAELADFGPEVVSMVAGVASDDDPRRTFRIERRKPDADVHATALAERHGLSYESIRERVR